MVTMVWRVFLVCYLLISDVLTIISHVDPERYTLMFSLYPKDGVFTGTVPMCDISLFNLAKTVKIIIQI